MSKAAPTASRRTVLSAFAIGATGVPTASPATAVPPFPTTTAGLDIRRASLRWLDAVRHEMAIEVPKGDAGFPAYRAAVAASNALEGKLEDRAVERLSRPMAGWADLVEVAELARHFAGQASESIGSESDEWGDALLALLANAVLFLATRTPAVPMPKLHEHSDEDGAECVDAIASDMVPPPVPDNPMMHSLMPDGRPVGAITSSEVKGMLAVLLADDPMLPCGTLRSQATAEQLRAARSVYEALRPISGGYVAPRA